MTTQNLSNYKLVEKINDDLFRISSIYGNQLFTKTTLRKKNVCAVCLCFLYSNDVAFKPITNGNNRMKRICQTCIEEI